MVPAIIVVVGRVFQGQDVSYEQHGKSYSNHDLTPLFAGRITEP